MNDIINFLDLEDENLVIEDIVIEESNKTITISTKPTYHSCPICQSIMYSKGLKTRTIRHPILQDGYSLIIKLKQRRWKCTNKECAYDMQESFKFVNKNRKVTNHADLMIVLAFKDLNKTAEDIGKEHNISGHLAMDIFNKYVHPKRHVLPTVISVDEVYLDMDSKCKYVLVLQDFVTGEPIDLVRSRRKEFTLPYFSNIPIKERGNVKYVISDMYNPYLEYVNQYFPNAISIVDSFHVMQWIIGKLDIYLKKLVKKYKERDEKAFKSKIHRFNQEKIPISDEVYLLQNYRWFLLKNADHIEYYSESKFNSHFKMYMNTYDLEKNFFEIDANLSVLRDLKEIYVEFNNSNAGKPDIAALELEELINYYSNCGQPIFVEFSNLLKKYSQPIINSFIHFEKITSSGETIESRLSNGPIESLNRKAKDLKRSGRGYANFEHLRKRFLFATRKDISL